LLSLIIFLKEESKQTSQVVCLVIQSGQKVILGKHADGPFKGKWGFASLSAELDRRPQECAAKLAEVCHVGMLGKSSALVKKCKKQGKTVNGLQVYCIQDDDDIDSLSKRLGHIYAYVKRCFPKGGIPIGVLAFSKCKVIDLHEKCDSLDPYTQDALQFLKLKL
jgi:hypothetical protein